MRLNHFLIFLLIKCWSFVCASQSQLLQYVRCFSRLPNLWVDNYLDFKYKFWTQMLLDLIKMRVHEDWTCFTSRTIVRQVPHRIVIQPHFHFFFSMLFALIISVNSSEFVKKSKRSNEKRSIGRKMTIDELGEPLCAHFDSNDATSAFRRIHLANIADFLLFNRLSLCWRAPPFLSIKFIYQCFFLSFNSI